MKELKDYFCTYRQTKQLMALGIIGVEHLKHITPSNEILHQLSESCLGAILRSQALDYFRELGYSAGLRGTTPYNWYLIDRPDKKIMSIKSGNYVSHVHCESSLIDKLIELEKEKRNEK